MLALLRTARSIYGINARRACNTNEAIASQIIWRLTIWPADYQHATGKCNGVSDGPLALGLVRLREGGDRREFRMCVGGDHDGSRHRRHRHHCFGAYASDCRIIIVKNGITDRPQSSAFVAATDKSQK